MRVLHHCASPLGALTLASDGEALTGLWFDGQRWYAEGLRGDEPEKDLPVFRQTEDWLAAYFQGRVPDFVPPLRLEGSAFQMRVWALLLNLPYGQTVTYGEIADALAAESGKRPAPRAFGAAVGHNPVSLIDPCPRVSGAGGRLTGYAGGLDRKLKLLQLEGAADFLQNKA